MAYQKGSPSDKKRKEAQAQTVKSVQAGKTKLGPGATVNPRGHLQGGGPAFVVDKKKLQVLAATMCSYDDMALVFGVPVTMLREHYQDVIDKGRAQARNGLRSSQFKLANSGNVVMQIWLGKQYLGQKDKTSTEVSGPDGGAVEVQQTKRVIAYMPDNGRDPSASPATAT